MSHIKPLTPALAHMRIAIPMAHGEFCEHFGTAKAFLVYEGDVTTRTLCCKELHGAPEHQPGALPKWLEAQNVDALVTHAIGARAMIMLADAGIVVFLAAEDRNPSALAQACLTGKLERATMENSHCNGEHHEHHDGHSCHH